MGDLTMNMGRPYKGEMIYFLALPVEPNFLTTMGIRITEGRNFRHEDATKEFGGPLIMNETARKMYGLKLHDKIQNDQIIGFMEDTYVGTLHKKVTPTAFYIFNEKYNMKHENCAIRLTSPEKAVNVSRMLNKLNKKLTDGQATMKFYSSDDISDIAYAVEDKQFTMVLTGSIISLLISLIGVFGLVLFETQARRKEIGVRKVFILNSTSAKTAPRLQRVITNLLHTAAPNHLKSILQMMTMQLFTSLPVQQVSRRLFYTTTEL